LIAFLKLPRSYTTLDEWLAVDEKKCEIVAVIIGCRCVDSLKQQQRENMTYRKTLANSFSEWMGLSSSEPKCAMPITQITKKYSEQRKCHRNYEGIDAGVRCYCDEHNH